MMHRLLRPHVLSKIFTLMVPFTGISCLGLFAYGLYISLVVSPADYQQGEAVRIMYIHVPSAWMSLMIYSIMAAMSALYLIGRTPAAYMIARASAPIGLCFTLITLITGSLWGKPIWGSYWVWDARLTSVLILLFFYLGYLLLIHSFQNDSKAATSSSILALVGVINIPLIKFSVEYWHTLHQPASILRKGGIAIHPSMLSPLLIMAAACLLLYLTLLSLRFETLRHQRKHIRHIQQTLHHLS
jgi:heme exporter protein C